MSGVTAAAPAVQCTRYNPELTRLTTRERFQALTARYQLNWARIMGVALGAIAVSVLLTPVAITVCLGAQAVMKSKTIGRIKATCFIN